MGLLLVLVVAGALCAIPPALRYSTRIREQFGYAVFFNSKNMMVVIGAIVFFYGVFKLNLVAVFFGGALIWFQHKSNAEATNDSEAIRITALQLFLWPLMIFGALLPLALHNSVQDRKNMESYTKEYHSGVRRKNS